MRIQKEHTAELFRAKDYRRFLKVAFEHARQSNAFFSFAFFSRKAGFSSRSYPRDVLVGKRRITAGSLPKFIKGLDLSGDSREYFTLLVALSEPDVNVERLTSTQIQARLAKIRHRAAAEPASETLIEDAGFYRRQSWLYIYASLGTPAGGASLEQIQMRTLLPKGTLRPELEEMARLGIVRYDAKLGRYFAKDVHLIFDNLGNNSFFKQHFLNSLVEVIQKARTNFDAHDRLFYNCVLSVNRAELPHLRQKLREATLAYVDSAANDEGDGLATLSVALLPLER